MSILRKGKRKKKHEETKNYQKTTKKGMYPSPTDFIVGGAENCVCRRDLSNLKTSQCIASPECQGSSCRCSSVKTNCRVICNPPTRPPTVAPAALTTVPPSTN